MVKIIFPESLHRFSDVGQMDLSLKKLSELSGALKESVPELHKVIYTDDSLRGFVNLYLNEKPVMNQYDQVTLSDQDTIEFIASVSGG